MEETLTDDGISSNVVSLWQDSLKPWATLEDSHDLFQMASFWSYSVTT